MKPSSAEQSEINREKAIYHYIQALDKGDLVAVLAVLKLAETDPELTRIILAINLEMDQKGVSSSHSLLIPTHTAISHSNIEWTTTGTSAFPFISSQYPVDPLIQPPLPYVSRFDFLRGYSLDVKPVTLDKPAPSPLPEWLRVMYLIHS